MSIPRDDSYLANDPVYDVTAGYGPPKEYFKRVAALARSHFDGRPITLLDVGCATGAFVHFARQALPIAAAVGVDNAEGLIAQARRLQPDAEFVVGSVADRASAGGRRFDMVTAFGLVGIFDDLPMILGNLWSWVRPGGVLYVYEHGNDDPVDVIVRYRRVDREDGEWRSGLNVRSRLTYERAVSALSPAATMTWNDFEMPFALPKVDPMRAWTVRTEAREHQLVVGTGQMLHFKIVAIAHA